MKLSMFTPTHRTDYLQRLKKSIDAQTFTNWEWVIVPNNGATIDFQDERINIVRSSTVGNIGKLKSFACANCTGDALLEVDHDDELTPDCLEEIAAAFRDDEVDFAFSNWCDVKPDYSSRTYDTVYGWQVRPEKYKDHTLQSMVSFPADPRSCSKIWYCPNHIRCWRSSFYRAVGGHDASLDILDDHDLVCRTYIKARGIKHVDKCLYLYHLHDNNTCYGEKNAKIQTMTLELHDKYIYPMVERWSEINKLRKINLNDGMENLEHYENYNVSERCFESAKWPFEDGSVGVFRAHDCLSLMRNPIHVMKEIYRCLVPNGWLLSLTPSTDGRGAFQDPRHVTYWNSNSFWYYTNRHQARFIGTPVKFQLNRVKTFFPSDWHKEHNISYVKADLVKFNGRTPGLIEI